jgi:hypothetical protein
MTSSSSHNDSSSKSVALARALLAAGLVLGTVAGAALPALAQTPPAESGQQPGQTQPQPSQPGQPTPAEPQQPPLLQFPIQQPGRPPITPGTPPSTTIQPWTPPVAPAPSQTNIPAPFPYATPGAAATPGLTGRAPAVTGAFAPTVTTVRGAFLEFHPTARASLDYSDNFFQTTSRSEENFRSILGPGFTLLVNGARTFASLSTTIDLVHDTARNSGDDVKVHPSLTGLIRYQLTPRLALSLSDTFIRDDSAQTADQFGIRRGRQTFSTNTASLTADWLLDQVALQAYYRNVLFFNESEGQQSGAVATEDQQDSITHILGLNASTRFAIDYILRAGYEFSKTDSTGGTVGNDNTSHTVFASVARQFGLYASAGVMASASFQSDQNTRIYNASLFGAYGLPTGLSVGARLGYSILQSDSGGNNGGDEGGLSAELNASYRFARAVFSVGVFQDFRQSGQTGQNFGTVESRSYFGSFLYQWTPFINTTLDATYSENEPTGTGNIDSGRTQTALTYGASLNWQILRWLTASLRYTHTKQTGNDVFNQAAAGGNGDFSENRAVVTLFVVF